MQYVQMVESYFRFSRSIRSSDIELCIDSVYEIANFFFIFNQPNYARWSVSYASDLLKLLSIDSDLKHQFLRGAFSIKRTKGNLSRAPVGLTIEQTFNADAENSLTGISHFTNSISARQRWALSHGIRKTIISKLMESVKITRKDDVTSEIQKARLDKDRKAVRSIVENIKSRVNPFSLNTEPSVLCNIVSGRATSVNVADFLLSVNKQGEEKKVQFLKDCEIDEKRFDKPIKRTAVLNFASDCIKKIQKSKDGDKQALIKMERDIFGRLLGIAMKKEIDINVCLSFPFAPAPPALCQYSGEMHKTDKSAFGKLLRSKIKSEPPRFVDIEVIDGWILDQRFDDCYFG